MKIASFGWQPGERSSCELHLLKEAQQVNPVGNVNSRNFPETPREREKQREERLRLGAHTKDRLDQTGLKIRNHFRAA